MKKTETERFKYTQKNMVIGDKMRSVIVIGKKPNLKSVVVRSNVIASKTVTRKKCGGCSRKRRG